MKSEQYSQIYRLTEVFIIIHSQLKVHISLYFHLFFVWPATSRGKTSFGIICYFPDVHGSGGIMYINF